MGGGYFYRTLNKDVKEINKVFLSLFSVGIILVAIFVGVNITKTSYALFSDKIVGEKTIEVEVITEDNWEYSYTGSSQTFIVPYDGTYKIELWGASLQYQNNVGTIDYRYGAYTSGEIELNKNEELYIYVGEMGTRQDINTTYNGGGSSSKGSYGAGGAQYYQNYSGGGATDIRLVSGSWNNVNSLRSRIMVAAGSGRGSRGGGISSENTSNLNTSCNISSPVYYTYGASQTAGGYGSKGGLAGSFGIGGNGEVTTLYYGSSGGGGGYYGGGGGYSPVWSSLTTDDRCAVGHSSGGSSYISGHTGCVAITSENSTTPKNGCTTGTTNNNCSIHYSEKVFTNTVMIDGDGYNWTNVKNDLTLMPNPEGDFFESEKGLEGNGYAKITLVY